MNNVLVIDDLRILHLDPDVFGDCEIRYARNAEQGIGDLSCYQWDQVWLDHDLGLEETIKPVVDFIVENQKDLDIRTIFVHSSNVVGRRNVIRFLETYTDYEIFEINLQDRQIQKHIIQDVAIDLSEYMDESWD